MCCTGEMEFDSTAIQRLQEIQKEHSILELPFDSSFEKSAMQQLTSLKDQHMGLNHQTLNRLIHNAYAVRIAADASLRQCSEVIGPKHSESHGAMWSMETRETLDSEGVMLC